MFGTPATLPLRALPMFSRSRVLGGLDTSSKAPVLLWQVGPKCMPRQVPSVRSPPRTATGSAHCPPLRSRRVRRSPVGRDTPSSRQPGSIATSPICTIGPNAGHTDAAALTKEIRKFGYRGGDKTVRCWLHPIRASRSAPPPNPLPAGQRLAHPSPARPERRRMPQAKDDPGPQRRRRHDVSAGAYLRPDPRSTQG